MHSLVDSQTALRKSMSKWTLNRSFTSALSQLTVYRGSMQISIRDTTDSRVGGEKRGPGEVPKLNSIGTLDRPTHRQIVFPIIMEKAVQSKGIVPHCCYLSASRATPNPTAFVHSCVGVASAEVGPGLLCAFSSIPCTVP